MLFVLFAIISIGKKPQVHPAGFFALKRKNKKYYENVRKRNYC